MENTEDKPHQGLKGLKVSVDLGRVPERWANGLANLASVEKKRFGFGAENVLSEVWVRLMRLTQVWRERVPDSCDVWNAYVFPVYSGGGAVIEWDEKDASRLGRVEVVVAPKTFQVSIGPPVPPEVKWRRKVFKKEEALTEWLLTF
jgi:hypothetical protein